MRWYARNVGGMKRFARVHNRCGSWLRRGFDWCLFSADRAGIVSWRGLASERHSVPYLTVGNTFAFQSDCACPFQEGKSAARGWRRIFLSEAV